MGQLTKKDVHFPLNNKTSVKVRGRIEKRTSRQSVAASLTDKFPMDGTGSINQLYVIFEAIAGSGESMVIDIQKNGTTVLTGTYTYDSTKTALVKTIINLMSLLVTTGAAAFVPGDIYSVVRTYTSGTATPIASSEVVMEYAVQ